VIEKGRKMIYSRKTLVQKRKWMKIGKNAKSGCGINIGRGGNHFRRGRVTMVFGPI
jgi:hypothetical protein